MRKKSHISLANYLVDSLDIQVLQNHKWAFRLGSILPDCKPSFLTTKHEFNGTFDMVKESIKRLVDGYGSLHENMRAFCRQLGQVLHYLADYFTYPHNEKYTGGLKDHCIYEKHLKYSLRDYIRSGEAERNQTREVRFATADALCMYIEQAHNAYLKLQSGLEEDCRYIVSICRQVARGVLELLLQHCGTLSTYPVSA